MSEQGERGPQGVQGERGPQGEQGEATVTTATDAIVANMVRAVMWSKRLISVLAVVCVVLAGVVGYLVYKSETHPLSNQLQTKVSDLEQYVQLYAQHSCNALDELTRTPVTAPADPAANPSRETNYKVYVALLAWKNEDHCK